MSPHSPELFLKPFLSFDQAQLVSIEALLTEHSLCRLQPETQGSLDVTCIGDYVVGGACTILSPVLVCLIVIP